MHNGLVLLGSEGRFVLPTIVMLLVINFFCIDFRNSVFLRYGKEICEKKSDDLSLAPFIDPIDLYLEHIDIINRL